MQRDNRPFPAGRRDLISDHAGGQGRTRAPSQGRRSEPGRYTTCFGDQRDHTHGEGLVARRRRAPGLARPRLPPPTCWSPGRAPRNAPPLWARGAPAAGQSSAQAIPSPGLSQSSPTAVLCTPRAGGSAPRPHGWPWVVQCSGSAARPNSTLLVSPTPGLTNLFGHNVMLEILAEATPRKNIRKRSVFSISGAHGFSEVQPWIFPASGFHANSRTVVRNTDAPAVPAGLGVARNVQLGSGLRFLRCGSRTALGETAEESGESRGGPCCGPISEMPGLPTSEEAANSLSEGTTSCISPHPAPVPRPHPLKSHCQNSLSFPRKSLGKVQPNQGGEMLFLLPPPTGSSTGRLVVG